MMHTFLEGAAKHLVHLVINPLTPTMKADFDFWTEKVFGDFQSLEHVNCLCSDFTHRFMNLDTADG